MLKLTNNNYWHEVKQEEYNILEIREIWNFRTFVAEANHGKTIKSTYRWLIFPQVPFSYKFSYVICKSFLFSTFHIKGI